MTARIKTGSTTWAERSLLATGWYPREVKTAEQRLRYYASRFPVVENDAGYWAVPDRERTQAWADHSPPGFTMNMKVHALLTGHYTDPRHLPRDVREALPAELLRKRHVYPRDVGDDVVAELERRFRDAMEPLDRAGRLGYVLFQFPVWFPIGRTSKRELERIAEAWAPYRVAIELRNATWMTEDNRGETLALLARLGLTYVCVDEPQGFPSSVPPLAAATTGLAVVRMHGRNAARWQRGARTAAERFEYLYTADELREWVPKVLDLAAHTDEVHVLMNNCHADYAVRNARDLAELVSDAMRTPRREPEREIPAGDSARSAWIAR